MKKKSLFFAAVLLLTAVSFMACQKDSEVDPDLEFDGKIVVKNVTEETIYVQYNSIDRYKEGWGGNDKWEARKPLSKITEIKPGKTASFGFKLSEFTDPNHAARQWWPAVCCSETNDPDGDWSWTYYSKIWLAGITTTIEVSKDSENEFVRKEVAEVPFKALDSGKATLKTNDMEVINQSTETASVLFIGWNHSGLSDDQYPSLNGRVLSARREIKVGGTVEVPYFGDEWNNYTHITCVLYKGDNSCSWKWDPRAKYPVKLLIEDPTDPSKVFNDCLLYTRDKQ